MSASAFEREHQRWLELSVLKAPRALAGSIKRRGIDGIPDATWIRFQVAERKLHEFHAMRQRTPR